MKNTKNENSNWLKRNRHWIERLTTAVFVLCFIYSIISPVVYFITVILSVYILAGADVWFPEAWTLWAFAPGLVFFFGLARQLNRHLKSRKK